MTRTMEAVDDFRPEAEFLGGVALSDEDIDDFVRLLPQLSSTERTRVDIVDNLLTALHSNHTAIAVVRDQDGRIQAAATGNMCPIPTGFKAWVDDVVTDEQHRGNGYGRMVTEKLHEWFLSRGATSANLTSRPERSEAGNLYESMGYEERDTRVYRIKFGLGSLAAQQAQQ